MPDWKVFFLEHEVTVRPVQSAADDGTRPEDRYPRARPDRIRRITDIYFEGAEGQLSRRHATLMLRMGAVDRPAVLRLKLVLGCTARVRHAVEMGSYVMPASCPVLTRDMSTYAVEKAREVAGDIDFEPELAVQQHRHTRYAALPDGHFIITSDDMVSFRTFSRDSWSKPMRLVALQVQTYDPVCLLALEDLVERYLQLGCIEELPKYALGRLVTANHSAQRDTERNGELGAR